MSLLRETKVKTIIGPNFLHPCGFSKHPSIISIKPGNKQYCCNKQHPRYKYFELTQTTNHSKISSPPSTSMDRAQLQDLKAEIEFERRLRRKAESLSRALAIELAEEREARDATLKVCEELAEELVKERQEMERVVEEVEEERRMMRVVETMREERVRMKMSEARMAMEEKMKELEEVMELRDEMGVSVSVMGIYGGFGLSLG
ncbi:uncharacterized protein A4U43_C07F27070 [Asparagus officinalis]|uniref:GTD-binding domain-containing protein n=1 Tax=Asparagus officinalis TaxID=4686 RepID=A0A5P1EIU5_ASPOF|nr:uncharacterized protein A4U43_C07F27070 [Asparagus officinalis]